MKSHNKRFKDDAWRRTLSGRYELRWFIAFIHLRFERISTVLMELKLRNFKSKPISKLLNLHSVAFIKRLTVITSLYIARVVIALYIKG